MENATENPNILRLNILGIITVMVVSFLIATAVNLPENSGGLKLVPLINPLIYGCLTLVLYFVVHKVSKKYSWIVSGIGILWMLYFAFNFYATWSA